MKYARLKRQFNFLLKTIRKYKAQNAWESLSLNVKSQLLKKITMLSKRLAGSFTPAYARKLSFALGISLLSYGASAQNFLAPVVNPFSLSGITVDIRPELVDIDDDGDLDMFYIDILEDSIFFRENIGTPSAPQFGPQQALPFGIEARPNYFGNTGLVFGDIDNDGDYDLFGGEYEIGNIYYQENIGTASNPNFQTQSINPFGINPPYAYYAGTCPDLVDIDDDGDLDLITSEMYGNIRFFENIGTPTSPSFNYVSNPTFMDSVMMHGFNYDLNITVVDIDNDCDYDLVFGYREVIDLFNTIYDEQLWLFENIGTKCAPHFASGVLDPFNYNYIGPAMFSDPEFGDLDNDGDQDLLIGYATDSLRYYEMDGSGIPVVTQGCDAVLQITSCDSYDFNGTNYTTSGQYDYTMISSIGCDSTTTVNLVINPVDSSFQTTVICEGDNYTYPDGFTETNINTGTSHISALSSVVTGCDSVVTTSITLNMVDIGTTLSGDTIYASAVGANYQWIDCGANTIVAGETGAFYAAGETGSYAVEVTEYDCVDTSACNHITITGISESNPLELNLYPNPSNGTINITLKDAAAQDLTVEIKNSLGQIIGITTIPKGSNNYQLQLNQPKGIYFLMIQTSVYKLIIE